MVLPGLSITAYLKRIQVNPYVNLPDQFNLCGTRAKLGRLEDSDFVLALPTISRNHAEFQFSDECWQIRDLRSLNGIEINYVALTPDSFATLANNDIISFSPGELADYRFVINESIPNDRRPDSEQGTTSQSVPVPGCSRSQNSQSPATENSAADNRKRAAEEPEKIASEQPGCSKLRKTYDESGSDSHHGEDTEAVTQPIEILDATSDESSSQNENSEAQGDLTSNTDEHQCHYRDLAENLQRELNEIRSERDNLQHIVDAQLISNQGASPGGLVEVLENELSCTICTEVVIEPTVAQCGHVFCSHCITAWIQQSNHSCPCCRKRIPTPARVRTWDHFLSRTYNLLSDESRQNRERVLQQRREEHEAWEARQATTGAEFEQVMPQRQDEVRDADDIPMEFIILEDPPVDRPAQVYERAARPREEEMTRRNVAAARRHRERRLQLGGVPRPYRRRRFEHNVLETSRPENNRVGPPQPVIEHAVINLSAQVSGVEQPEALVINITVDADDA